jgi:spore coat protein CotF
MTELTVQEILQDLLVCEKYMLEMYKQYTIEASNLALKDLCIENMVQTFDLQYKIFEAMEARGYYPLENAKSNKVQQAIKTITENTKYYDDTF